MNKDTLEQASSSPGVMEILATPVSSLPALPYKSLSVKRHICEAIAEHSEITSQALRNQWRQLILQPLLKLDSDSPHPSLLIVVGALDECEGENDIRVIVQLFTEAQLLRSVRLWVFITSRPEISIIF